MATATANAEPAPRRRTLRLPERLPDPVALDALGRSFGPMGRAEER
jgi:hypothetical protein